MAEPISALKASIVKWESNVAQMSTKDLVFGAQSCPLCEEFNDEHTPYAECCKGCPVFASTGRQLCEGTPYDAVIAYRFFRYREIYVTDELRKLMQAELDFLRSLDTDAPT